MQNSRGVKRPALRSVLSVVYRIGERCCVRRDSVLCTLHDCPVRVIERTIMGHDFAFAVGFWIGVAALVAATIGSLVFLHPLRTCTCHRELVPSA